MPTVRKWYETILNSRGEPASGVRVAAYTAGTTTPVTLYDTSEGTTLADNPATTDGNGYIEFYIPPGTYDLALSGNGFASRTLRNIFIPDGTSAESIAFTPTADVTSTNTQAAVAEVGGGLAGHLADTDGAHDASAISYTAAGTGSVPRTQKQKNDETVSVKNFGAVGDGVTDDTASINKAFASGAKAVNLVQGERYLVTSDSVGADEGACFVLGAAQSGLRIVGNGATIVTASNKLQAFCINGADDVSIDGVVFDNSANGLLQNQPKVLGAGVPNGGIAGNGNAANAAISLFSGSGLTVSHCEFKSFVLGIYYIHDYTDDSVLGGHLSSKDNVFRGCVQGHLVDTPESYEINGSRCYDNDDSVNSDASIDPGHLLYVTNRTGAVPKNGVVSNVFNVGGKSSPIKIRKGRSLAVSNIVSFQSSRGLEIWNVQEGAVSNCAITLATVGTTTNNSAVQLSDCGALRVSNLLLDIRNVDAWGMRITPDASASAWANKNWSLADITVLADYTTLKGKAAFNVNAQTQYLIDNCRWIVEGAVPNTKRMVDCLGSTYGVLRNLQATFANPAASVGFVSLDVSSNYNTVHLNKHDAPVFSAGSYYGDAGTGNVISAHSISMGSAAAPSLSFLEEPTLGIYRHASGVLAVAVGGAAKVGVTSTDLRPMTDNTQSLGVGANRWSVVFAGTGAINTSDAREKQQIRDISEKERAVAVRLKGLIRAFKFNDAVEKKGDGARIHVGVIAQDVKEAFEEVGLNPFAYALLCYDEWDEGQNRYGVRYDELLAFVLAAL